MPLCSQCSQSVWVHNRYLRIRIYAYSPTDMRWSNKNLNSSCVRCCCDFTRAFFLSRLRFLDHQIRFLLFKCCAVHECLSKKRRNSTNCSTYFLCCDHAIQINWTTNCLWFVRVSLCLWIRLIHRDSSILSGLFKCQISHGWKKAHTIFTCIKENFFSIAKWQSVNKIKSLRFFSDEFSTLFKLCTSVYVSVYD